MNAAKKWQISTVPADEVLISSSKCGQVNENTTVDEFLLDVQPYSSKITTASASYAQQCYGSTTKDQECSVFIQNQLPQTMSRNASCPFPGKNKICKQDSNIRIDSGFIDSHKHFGINSPPKDRFTYRSVIECGPLRTEGYTRITNKTSNTASNSVVNLLYGSQPNGNHQNDSVSWAWPIEDPSLDYGITYVKFVIQCIILLIDSSTRTWEIGDYGGGDFQPIPELLRDDADTSLFFMMANAINFLKPVDDELFAAHRPKEMNFTRVPNETHVVYLADESVQVLGCALQTQYCLGKDRCTPLTGFEPASDLAETMTVTDHQYYNLKSWLIENEQINSVLANVVATLGPSALLARDNLFMGDQGPLPVDQWHREVEHWQATTLAKMQRIVVEFATGPSDANVQQYVIKPSDVLAKQRCQNQVSTLCLFLDTRKCSCPPNFPDHNSENKI